MSFLSVYLLLGAGFYIGVSCARMSSFEGASARGVFTGIAFGLLLWPLVILYFSENYYKRKKS